jgi:hypothetical protein
MPFIKVKHNRKQLQFSIHKNDNNKEKKPNNPKIMS